MSLPHNTMAELPIYNQEGKESGSITVRDDVFAIPASTALIHQVYTAQMANQRQPWAHSKDRSEVRGGGKKPWRQKGTGRARHGSIRSPLWSGGGVTFGPLKSRTYSQKINKKMNKQAVRMCLSDKVKRGQLVVISDVPSDGKTRSVATLRQHLPGVGKTTMFVLPGTDAMVMRASKNIPRLDVRRAADINVVDLLHHQYVVMSKEAVAALEKRLAKS